MTGPLQTSVCIVGAGPAGSLAALALAKSGQECMIIDKSRFPRDKTCGDGISGKFLSNLARTDPSLAMELCSQDFVTRSFGVRFFSPSGRSVLVSLQQDGSALPPGLICRRRDLDHFLVMKLKSMPGIRLIEEVSITGARLTQHGIMLLSDHTSFACEAKLVLLATGSNPSLSIPGSPLARNTVTGLGVRAYFENVSSPGPENAIEIHFLKELLPWYLWIFPFRDGSANAGIALPIKTIREKRIKLADLFLSILEQYPHIRERFVNARMLGKVSAASLAINPGTERISGDRFMLLGDAANLTDPFTGEGIGNAAFSGRMAALTALECIERDDFSANRTKSYDLRINQGLRKEFELDRRLNELAHNKSLLNLVIGRASRSRKVRNLIEEMLYDLNTKGRLGNQLFYLKLLLHLKV